MNIENIIHAWKADEDHWEVSLANPVGQELTEEELLQVFGGDNCVISNCGVTCSQTCGTTCGSTACGSTNGGCSFFTL
jgi:hypothetical protein